MTKVNAKIVFPVSSITLYHIYARPYAENDISNVIFVAPIEVNYHIDLFMHNIT